MNPLIQSKNATILPVLIALMLACFGLSPQARAVCQEGCDLRTGSTVLGDNALLNNKGGNNTAIGDGALYSNTFGFYNTGIGAGALFSNTTGGDNVAIGLDALYYNTTGSNNIAIGFNALGFNTTGSNNTATGWNALTSNTTGGDNTAHGLLALLSNTTGNNNTATGIDTLESNTTGNNNTATGAFALGRNTTANNNTAVGHNALVSNRTGNGNIALGVSAGANLTDGDRNIDIGNVGVAGESKTIRIGTVGTHKGTFIAGISGVTVPDGVGVIVGSDGKLGTVVSSARFKDSIRPMNKTSEAILALQPVTFRYKHELDPDGIPQFGLVAEQVEKVNPDLVARDEQGKPYTVRYEAVNAMLLNEFLKEHRKVEKQSNEIAELKASVAELKSALLEQAEAIRKVGAQVAADHATLRIVSTTE